MRPCRVERSGTWSRAWISSTVSHGTGFEAVFFDAIALIWPRHAT